MPTLTFTAADIRALKRAKQYVSFPMKYARSRYELHIGKVVAGTWRA